MMLCVERVAKIFAYYPRDVGKMTPGSGTQGQETYSYLMIERMGSCGANW
ncbi:hypothetical protein SAMN05660330_03271 [Desulforhopalus singaporensis]|uniref:Uncharacterized protein n=1 Tax=Desulforhopalus singaporensis TaxID=91360 RepID=A0A1H0TWZ3_9BACT|nr:hypothetical protein SAMN05660330_03271 [Desulforhopalus singaporensis]